MIQEVLLIVINLFWIKYTELPKGEIVISHIFACNRGKNEIDVTRGSKPRRLGRRHCPRQQRLATTHHAVGFKKRRTRRRETYFAWLTSFCGIWTTSSRSSCRSLSINSNCPSACCQLTYCCRNSFICTIRNCLFYKRKINEWQGKRREKESTTRIGYFKWKHTQIRPKWKRKETVSRAKTGNVPASPKAAAINGIPESINTLVTSALSVFLFFNKNPSIEYVTGSA